MPTESVGGMFTIFATSEFFPYSNMIPTALCNLCGVHIYVENMGIHAGWHQRLGIGMEKISD